MPYYFDVTALKCFEVTIIERLPGPRSDLLKVYDKGRSALTDYVVPAAKVCSTELLAIQAAAEDLRNEDDEVLRQLSHYQNRHEQIDKLLSLVP